MEFVCFGFSKGIKELYFKNATLKHADENIGNTLQDAGIGKNL